MEKDCEHFGIKLSLFNIFNNLSISLTREVTTVQVLKDDVISQGCLSIAILIVEL